MRRKKVIRAWSEYDHGKYGDGGEFSGPCRHKKCNECGDWVRVQDFPKSRNKPLGIGSECSECSRLLSKARYTQNPSSGQTHNLIPFDEEYIGAVQHGKCRKCLEWVDLRLMPKDKSMANGRQTICKFCLHTKAKE